MKERPPIQEVFNEAMANVLGVDLKAIKQHHSITVLEALTKLLCDESRNAWEAGTQNCMGPITPEEAEGKLRAILQEIANLRIPQ
jgi:hypothetical protein